jgi:replicative DNA helicase
VNLNLVTGADLLGTWLADVETGTPPTRFRLSAPFAPLDVRPGRLILFGGPPGAGKTAALLQTGIDLLRLNDTVRLVVANVEMSPRLLLERVISRVSGVPLTAITDRTLNPEQRARVRAAVGALAPAAARLAFAGPPFALEHVALAGTEFQADVLILDYVQRFTVGAEARDQRDRLDSAMGVLRKFCDSGAAVLAAAAVSRQRGSSGSNYHGLNLASFRGSSELEYGSDACYLLVPDREGPGVSFECGKNRYGSTEGFRVLFDPVHQSFVEAPELSLLERFDAAIPATSRGRSTKGG